MRNSLFRRLIRTLVFTSTFFGGLLNQPVLSREDKKKKAQLGCFREPHLGVDNSVPASERS